MRMKMDFHKMPYFKSAVQKICVDGPSIRAWKHPVPWDKFGIRKSPRILVFEDFQDVEATIRVLHGGSDGDPVDVSIARDRCGSRSYDWPACDV